MATFKHRFTATVDEQRGELKTPGVDWGAPLKIVHRSGDYVVVRCKGHQTWSGVGMPWIYAPATLMLVHVNLIEHGAADESRDGMLFTRTCGEVIEEIEPGRKWRKPLQELIKKCNNLALFDKKAHEHRRSHQHHEGKTS